MIESKSSEGTWSPKERQWWLEYYELMDRFYQLTKPRYADMYAKKYETRGQIDEAVELWKTARSLRNITTDSLACQALLKSPTATNVDILKGHQDWASSHALRDDKPTKFSPYDGRRKIRVGYICMWWDSPTIRGQAIPFISHHDRSKFHLVGYSPTPCATTITSQFDQFTVTDGMSDADFVDVVRSDAIDILIEFTGFSPNHRFGAMGARCAPIQVSYLNHTATSGVPNVDYVLADEIAAPYDIDPYYTEKIYRLPGSFFCFNYDWDNFPEIGAPPCLRTGRVTFACFGSQSKINDAIIKMWADLLNRISNSRLFLRNMGLSSRENRKFMERRFAQWGIASDRLLLTPGTDRSEILRNYSEVDISLDTWPYCGGNTIAESLWLGVPVITLKGKTFSSAYGASLLHASGCDDLIATSTEQYCDIAAKLAQDRERLVFYRQNLRQMMFKHGFSDAKKFARKLETAFVDMMHKRFPIT